MTPEVKKKKFGWKNYPILSNEQKSKKGNNDDIVSEFIPLESNTRFEGKLRFHNLRDFEIGALISALTFHNTEHCYHNIGYAKSLGYGKITINFEYKHTIKVLQAFEEKINIEIFDGKILWHKSEYIKELLNKHANNNTEFKAYSDEVSLKELSDLLRKKKEQDIANQKQKILDKVANIEYIPERKSQEFKDAIRDYILHNISLPYYEYNDLKKVFEKKEDDIAEDDIYNAYMDLFDVESFKFIEPLLQKREHNKANDLELAELYKLLIQRSKNG